MQTGLLLHDILKRPLCRSSFMLFRLSCSFSFHLCFALSLCLFARLLFSSPSLSVSLHCTFDLFVWLFHPLIYFCVSLWRGKTVTITLGKSSACEYCDNPVFALFVIINALKATNQANIICSHLKWELGSWQSQPKPKLPWTRRDSVCAQPRASNAILQSTSCRACNERKTNDRHNVNNQWWLSQPEDNKYLLIFY